MVKNGFLFRFFRIMLRIYYVCNVSKVLNSAIKREKYAQKKIIFNYYPKFYHEFLAVLLALFLSISK